MLSKLPSYLRYHRRRWGLTQRELAYLLGLKSGSAISRIERNVIRPSLAIALACQVLFDAPLLELFPGTFSVIEGALVERAEELSDRLQRSVERATEAKSELIAKILARAATSVHV
jgi:transcriptional regulator with XRE-family HTH domain